MQPKKEKEQNHKTKIHKNNYEGDEKLEKREQWNGDTI